MVFSMTIVQNMAWNLLKMGIFPQIFSEMKAFAFRWGASYFLFILYDVCLFLQHY